MFLIALVDLIYYAYQANVFERNPNFFQYFAPYCVLNGFHPIHFTAWHTPVPSFRIAPPLKQQNLAIFN